MRVIFKNSKLLFKNKQYTQINPTSTLNTPTSFYVDSKKVKAGGNGGGVRLFVDVFQVSANTEYTIKSAQGWQPGNAGLVGYQQICFGTNLLAGTGDISDAVVVKTFNSQSQAYSMTYTPSANGYLYVTQFNYTNLTPQVICISEVYE